MYSLSQLFLPLRSEWVKVLEPSSKLTTLEEPQAVAQLCIRVKHGRGQPADLRLTVKG
jgi:hypothetical protein